MKLRVHENNKNKIEDKLAIKIITINIYTVKLVRSSIHPNELLTLIKKKRYSYKKKRY